MIFKISPGHLTGRKQQRIETDWSLLRSSYRQAPGRRSTKDSSQRLEAVVLKQKSQAVSFGVALQRWWMMVSRRWLADQPQARGVSKFSVGDPVPSARQCLAGQQLTTPLLPPTESNMSATPHLFLLHYARSHPFQMTELIKLEEGHSHQKEGHARGATAPDGNRTTLFSCLTAGPSSSITGIREHA